LKGIREFRTGEDDAVSAVIGVILMVAITVAIAATVYVYVSGMIGESSQSTPSIACNTDHSGNKLIITSARPFVSWADINVTILGGGVTTYYEATTDVVAGDIIDLSAYLATNSSVVVTFRFEPTNSLIGDWKVY
jgi:FlaG/FlaF family flagellin (archaellin)